MEIRRSSGYASASLSYWLGVTLLIALTVVRSIDLDLQGGRLRFEADIQPVLTANCISCHGSKISLKDLNLSTPAGLLKGSESGPVVVPGKPDESRLYQYVRDG